MVNLMGTADMLFKLSSVKTILLEHPIDIYKSATKQAGVTTKSINKEKEKSYHETDCEAIQDMHDT